MKPNHREIYYALKRVLIVALLAMGIWILARTRSSPEPDSKAFSSRQLDSDRQIVWVNADSLAGLLNRLQKEQSTVFRWKDEDQQFVFQSLSDKPFNDLFLDGEYISRFDSVRNTGVEKQPSGYGFQLPTKTKSSRRFVRMPAEIMHSIQLQTANH